MHGCPPDEIEKIGLYLIGEKKFDTVIKLNPTLLGPQDLRGILNDRLGYHTEVPDAAFEHDLKYNDAITIIKSLQKEAAAQQVFFGLKLTNTLESMNNRPVFPAKESMMYMSGRALHVISVQLAAKLQLEFDGKLDISFSAGADFRNISELLACGLSPVTVCSDILKPGGYGRLQQYVERIREALNQSHAQSIDDFICKKAGVKALNAARIKNLQHYATEVLVDDYYNKDPWHSLNIKTNRKLGFFDCIAAPCVDTCPSNQEIPQYMYYAAKGELDKGLDVILRTNPFPNVCGLVCDHICHTKCTRINYDQSLRIREVKRFIAENALANDNLEANTNKSAKRIAIIGAGPSGLACAYFLRQAGFSVTVYEAKNLAGGMVADAIPAFRLSEEAIRKDIDKIVSTGVEIHYGVSVDAAMFASLRETFDFVYVAVGAQQARKLRIEGEALSGVLDPLKFLSDVRRGNTPVLGKSICIIGGGNTAMDVARTSKRLSGKNSEVTLVYRRTRREMPADPEEVQSALNDGINLLELVAPLSIAQRGSQLSLICERMQLSGKDASGRMKPVPIPNSTFEILADIIIPAAGQEIDLPFLSVEEKQTNPETYETQIANVFLGGDAFNGGVSIIRAIGDGRKVATTMIRRAHMEQHDEIRDSKGISYAELMKKRSVRAFGMKWEEHPMDINHPFALVSEAPSAKAAAMEASRCLYCDELCNICVTVCPNRANFSYSLPSLNIPLFLAEPAVENAKVTITPKGRFEISQQRQVANVADFCNECGNCATFCPTAGRPYADKPRFCLTAESFRKEDHAFYFAKQNNRSILFRREGENVMSIEACGDQWFFEDESVQLVLSNSDYSISSLKYFPNAVKPFHTGVVAEMLALYIGLNASPYFN